MSYKPRGILARAVYEKVHNDQYLDNYDMNLWYTLEDPVAERFQAKFVSLNEPDSRTLKWLDTARNLSANFWLQLWHLVARMFLTTFMTQTDINGYLKRGSMFILSEEQFGRLLKAGGFDKKICEYDNDVGAWQVGVLDIGAGDGEVTQRLINAVHQMGDHDCDNADEHVQIRVYASEYSYTMRKRLTKRNYIVIDKLSEMNNMSLISCLNVLDRCADPHQILLDIHRALAPNGRAIIALVLPYSHFVESNSSHLPIKALLPHWSLNSHSPAFDVEATVFFEELERMGFQIEAWTKAPYLCEGDLRQSFYWLIDVVVVLSKKEFVEPERSIVEPSKTK